MRDRNEAKKNEINNQIIMQIPSVNQQTENKNQPPQKDKEFLKPKNIFPVRTRRTKLFWFFWSCLVILSPFVLLGKFGVGIHIILLLMYSLVHFVDLTFVRTIYLVLVYSFINVMYPFSAALSLGYYNGYTAITTSNLFVLFVAIVLSINYWSIRKKVKSNEIKGQRSKKGEVLLLKREFDLNKYMLDKIKIAVSFTSVLGVVPYIFKAHVLPDEIQNRLKEVFTILGFENLSFNALTLYIGIFVALNLVFRMGIERLAIKENFDVEVISTKK